MKSAAPGIINVNKGEIIMKNYICDECKKNNATVYYKQTVNGKTTEKHLCAECADKYGIFEKNDFGDFWNGAFVDPFEDVFSKMFFGLPAASNKLASPERCPTCGSTLGDIRRESRMGCPDCYTVFREFLEDGDTKYKGRAPKTRGSIGERAAEAAHKIKENVSEKVQAVKEKISEAGKADPVAEMRAELKKAVAEENYEKAAELRDKIRAAESKNA